MRTASVDEAARNRVRDAGDHVVSAQGLRPHTVLVVSAYSADLWIAGGAIAALIAAALVIRRRRG